ncbi:unnamed protein product, partial [Effrenium voratum]
CAAGDVERVRSAARPRAPPRTAPAPAIRPRAPRGVAGSTGALHPASAGRVGRGGTQAAEHRGCGG